MKLAVYSTKQYDKKYLQQVNESFGFELEFFDFLLTEKTAKTANGCEAVCIFVNDDGSRPVLEELKKHGVKYIALRCAGFNNVDLDAAKELGLKVVRVPAYDPEAVAEHAIGMMMTLNRRIHRAYQRTRDANFFLEGLTGFTMYGKTAGVIGTGKNRCGDAAHSERFWYASAGVRSVSKCSGAGTRCGVCRSANPVL